MESGRDVCSKNKLVLHTSFWRKKSIELIYYSSYSL